MSNAEAVALQRTITPQRGATFYREDGVLMFTFVIDTGNIIGPRPAAKSDSLNHPEAWLAFTSGEEAQATVDVVPDAREIDPPAAPLTVVPEKDMGGFVQRLEPAPPRQKRAYTRRQKVA